MSMMMYITICIEHMFTHQKIADVKILRRVHMGRARPKINNTEAVVHGSKPVPTTNYYDISFDLLLFFKLIHVRSSR